jgi:putative hydrolase of the HAD superfamily
VALKAVLFDLDDTLLWDERSVAEAFQATCALAASRYPIDPVQLEAAVREEAKRLFASYETYPFTRMIGINPFEGLWAKFDGGTLESFRLLERLAPDYRKHAWTLGLKAMGIEDEPLGEQLAERFPEERRKRPFVYDDTFPVLDALKHRYKLLLLTNGAPDLQQEKIAGIPSLAEYFDHIVISGAFGEGKPAASIFHYAMQLLDIEPEEGIMVGDKLTTDILGANTVGMPSVWINRHGIDRTGDIVPVHEIRQLSDLLEIIRHYDEKK